MRASVAIILSLFCVAVLASESRYQTAFTDYMQKYSKSYHSDEFQARYKIFKQNMDFVEAHNMNNMKSYKLAMNAFGDLSHDEFKKYYLGLQMPSNFNAATWGADFSLNATAPAPASVDWRTKGAVTPVKNQEQCGSCWAFSAIGNLEGQWFLAGHTLVGLSEQNLVDCDHTCIDGGCDAGCDGGLMPNAWTYIMNNGGVDTESSYPYLGYDSTCDYSASNIGATVKNWTMIAGNETQMAAYCAANGPISIAVDAEAWQFYEFGIFQDPWCGDTLDHGVLIVGYDHEVDWFGEDLAFWWVKNSWGEDWGYDGYIKLAKGDEQCGDNLFPCSSIV